MDAFRKVVLAHERKHETSLNKCIRTVNTDGRLEAVEAIVGKSESAARDSAMALWTKGVAVPLFKARETDQSTETSKNPFWWWYSSWVKGLHRLKGHIGTDGCP